MKITLIRFIVISILSILVVSCASTKHKPGESTQEDIAQAKNLATSGDYKQAAKIYQGLASKEKSPAKDKLLLRALDLYIKSRQYPLARKSAVSIKPSLLSSRERVLYHLLYGKSEIKLGHQRNALKQLDQISPSLLARPEQQLYHILRVKALEGLDKDFDSVRERIQLSRFLDEGGEYEHNNRKIAKTLRQITPARLRHQRSAAPQTLRGWVDYILISQETLPDSAERERYLQRWRDQYPGHPAVYSAITPQTVERPAQSFGVPSNIAVLLPHSGSYTAAAHAIKQGMLTARDEQDGSFTPRIKFYDSTAADITTIYQRTLSDGAEFIIGPLLKQTIQQLLESNTLDKPMLALNQLDGVAQNNLYQLGLNPRDEIEQAAALAWQDGHRRALVFVPETSLGARAGRLFSEYWDALGGKTLEIVSYTSNPKELSKSVSALLNLNESLSRRRRLQNQVGKLEFTPRPRHDADMLFMLAKPTEARIVRPLLSFYRVSNLPVYTTSKVYSGKPNPSLDRDLSGIVFCGDSSQFDQSILEMQQEIAAQYQVAARNIPLFNLGYDTYALISELSNLQQNPARRMSGKTGTLWLDSDNNLRRQLTCGKFKDGLVQKLGLGPILKADRNVDEDHLHQQQAEPHQQNSHSHGAYKKSWLERSQLIPE